MKLVQERGELQVSDEVATAPTAFVPEPYRRLPAVNVESPVPPLATAICPDSPMVIFEPRT
jgi:hypothetical protein